MADEMLQLLPISETFYISWTISSLHELTAKLAFGYLHLHSAELKWLDFLQMDVSSNFVVT